MARFCAECGAANTGGRFCSECGTRFADASSSGNGNGSFLGAQPPPPPLAEKAVAVALPVAAPYAAPVASAAAGAAVRQFRHNPTANGSFAANGGGGAGYAAPSGGLSPPRQASGSFTSAFRGKNIPPPPPPPPQEPVPAAAAGAEAQQVYEQCVATIRNSRGGANEQGVKEFKANCRAFGLKEMDVRPFYDSLSAQLGAEGVLNFVPLLARLIPDDDRRKELIDYNAQQRATFASSAALRDSNSSSGSSTGRPSAFANNRLVRLTYCCLKTELIRDAIAETRAFRRRERTISALAP